MTTRQTLRDRLMAERAKHLRKMEALDSEIVGFNRAIEVFEEHERYEEQAAKELSSAESSDKSE